jgi:hypothetical protein
MPRYYFNVIEGNDSDVINDTEGVVLSSQRVARKKAIGLARDIVKDGLVPEPIENWKIVVTLRNGVEVLPIRLSKTHARNIWVLLHPRQLMPSRWLLGPGPSERFAASAGLGIAIQGAVMAMLMIVSQDMIYQTASAPGEHGIVAVRFAPQVSPAVIAEFLDRYEAEVIGIPRQSGFYRMRIREQYLQDNELSAVVSRMMQESIVELAASAE